MQKKTLGWEPSTETMYPADGGLEGRCDKALKLVGGGHLHVNFKTTYKSKKPVKMPGVHYVDRRLERIKEADNETYVEQYEHAVARYSNLGGGMDELYKCFARPLIATSSGRCSPAKKGKVSPPCPFSLKPKRLLRVMQASSLTDSLRSVVRLRRAVSAHSKAVIRLSTESGDNAGKNM